MNLALILKIAKYAGAVIAGLAIAWAIYAGIIRPVTKPNPSTTQSGETINNYYNTPRISFGCARFEVKNDKPVSVPVSDDSK
jgi:hypothetical protein